MNTVLSRIQDSLPALSPSEKKVAEWILKNPNLSADATIMETADSAGVSQPTVVRFCKRIGLSRFRDLKMHLAAALQQPESYFHLDANQLDSPLEAASKVLERSIQTLAEVRAHLPAMPFNETVGILQNARQLIFAGTGASGIVAQDARHKFFRLGQPCTTALDHQTSIQLAAIAEPTDVFFFISSTGNWPESVRAASLATTRGAATIALTNPISPLAQTVDLVFDCQTPEDPDVYTPMSSRLVPIVILDAIQVALAIALGNSASDKLVETKLAISALH